MSMRERLRLHHEYAGVMPEECEVCNPVQPLRSVVGRERSRARWERWAQEYPALSVRQIARRDGVTTSAVYMAFRAMGIERVGRNAGNNTQARPAADIEEAIRLYRDEGLTYEQIGHEFGVTRERVRQWFARHGEKDLAQHRIEDRVEARKHRVCDRCGETYDVGTPHFAAGNHPLRLGSKTDPMRWEGMAADYAAGMTLREIIAKWDSDASVIMRSVEAHGLPRRRPTFHRGTREEVAAGKARILELAATGLNNGEIAREVGCSDSWAHMVRKAADGR